METGGLFELPLPKNVLRHFLLNCPSGSGEENEDVKSLQTDGQKIRRSDGGTKDNRRSENLTSFQVKGA